MSVYQALYRKYRPRTFSQVVGQSHITDTLQRQVAEGQVGHAYLFTGTRGTGKTTCARILAKAVNCESPVDGAPCNRCAACRGIDDGSLLDVTELDAASNGSVSDARSLREEAVYPPSVLRRRVYIIDEVHMLSRDAFNALLKIMEEPPEHLLFILATTELQKVPATILSRCQRFSFKRILPQDMERQLLHVAGEEGIDLTADGAELLARIANGALRDALSLLDQCRAAAGTIDASAVLSTLGLAGSTQTLALLRLLLARQSGEALALLDGLYRSGKDVGALLGELSDLMRDMTVMKAAPEGGAALLTGLYDRKTLTELGQNVSVRRLLYMTETIQRCAAALPNSIRQRTDAELCLLRLCDESLCGDTEALDGRISALEDAVQRGIPVASAPEKRPALPAERPVASVKRTAPAREERPPLPEESPLPEEPPEENDRRRRVFDIPDAPPPPVVAAPVQPAPASAMQGAVPAGDGGVWDRLLEHYKGRLPVNFRVMLNMARGTLEGDSLLVTCRDDFTLRQLDCPTVLSVLQEVTAKDAGHPVRVQFRVGALNAPSPQRTAAPVQHPAPVSAPPPPPVEERPPLPEEPPLPEDTAQETAAELPPTTEDRPPWEEPSPAPVGQDRLEELLKNGQRLEGFQIKSL